MSSQQPVHPGAPGKNAKVMSADQADSTCYNAHRRGLSTEHPIVQFQNSLIDIRRIAECAHDTLVHHQSTAASLIDKWTEVERLRHEMSFYKHHLIPDYDRTLACLQEESLQSEGRVTELETNNIELQGRIVELEQQKHQLEMEKFTSDEEHRKALVNAAERITLQAQKIDELNARIAEISATTCHSPNKVRSPGKRQRQSDSGGEMGTENRTEQKKKLKVHSA